MRFYLGLGSSAKLLPGDATFLRRAKCRSEPQVGRIHMSALNCEADATRAPPASSRVLPVPTVPANLPERPVRTGLQPRAPVVKGLIFSLHSLISSPGAQNSLKTAV